MTRYIAVLFLSGFSNYTIDKFGQNLCISDYITTGTVTYFKELNGVSANDPSMLGMCGPLTIILIFIKTNTFMFLLPLYYYLLN